MGKGEKPVAKPAAKSGDDSKLGITAKKADDFAEWYPQVVLKAELADYSPVKGCMVIRPRGYAIWEAIQARFQKRLDALNVRNAYFPLFIPESFFKKEAKHAEGFKPEVAWIEREGDGERLAVRPTSETIMYDMYGKWIRSHRDLPLRINQWCNVVRWETSQTRLFLRTREFLWQEGHCAYASQAECDAEVKLMIEEYKGLVEGLLAIPVIIGTKTEHEKFAGAQYTLTIEAFMPDGRALQCGTSHNLGQGFAEAFGISFLGEDGASHKPWQSSWGFSTRLIGALVMTHGDDKGLVLPPNAAREQAVIVPILFDDSKDAVLAECRALQKSLADDGIRAFVDDREGYNPGWKYNEWELKGVPLRIELGPKDLAKKQAVLVRRNDGHKTITPLGSIRAAVHQELEIIQQSLFARAKEHLEASITEVASKDEFIAAIEARKLVLAPFCCDIAVEDEIKEQTGATTRCIPINETPVSGQRCFWTGKKATHFVYFARAY